MYGTNLEPSLDSLLDQFEDIGGPETFGPNGTAIILAIWRKSRKLGWLRSFQMTNTELHFQTGIKSRETINTYRDRLASNGIMVYQPPPRGKSKGAYILNFNFISQKQVHNLDNLTDYKGQVVQESNSFDTTNGNEVHNLDNLTDTVLRDFKDTITTTDNPFELLLGEFCSLHSKLDIHVKRNDIVSMQWMLDQHIPVALIIRVMRELHRERTATGKVISTFVYYKQAILDAWDAAKAITDRAPIPAVALGEESITSGVPVSEVALGSSKRTKQQQEIDALDKFIEEERRRRGSD
ncbi:hypothetical protein PAECIP111893_00289 [Paenibacillus plantiphilus]|uniref:DnaD domain-containing protein n=1 Tax=Paenibacillus plantiphilus TaxID=2905650 RepID=A0ABM9BM04_9BACL|nr:hypothetical protein [Paenibacillus plantiphilus]CAH1190352.1 hypothetical protein PAECIP111893_00289 [Paenibacillus plantiphilus]